MRTRQRSRDNGATIAATILGYMAIAIMIISLWLIDRRVERLTTRLEDACVRLSDHEDVITRMDAVIETVRGIVQSEATRGATGSNNQQAPEETP